MLQKISSKRNPLKFMNHINLNSSQKTHMEMDFINEDRKKIHQSWFAENTVDFWRHSRMYDTIQQFALYYKDLSWLTIGDGRYGLDSIRLRKKFDIKNIFPTDISGSMLKYSKEKGFIDNYGVENAEALSFEDNSFDIVFTKESMHHWPRPYLGIYEMLRVAAKAVILIEPFDNHSVVDVRSDYEKSGNFIFRVNLREFNKIIHSCGCAGIAYTFFNDAYESGAEFEKFDEKSEILKKIQLRIHERDSSKTFSMTSLILFKDEINLKLKTDLEKDKFIFPIKFQNPYL